MTDQDHPDSPGLRIEVSPSRYPVTILVNADLTVSIEVAGLTEFCPPDMPNVRVRPRS